MKPIIVLKNEDGTISMKLEEFERAVKEAYNEGKKDGSPILINPVYVPSTPAPIWPSGPTYDPFRITCGGLL